MWRILLLGLVAAAANATTVFPELHDCPVCGVKSVKTSIGSFSQFGEPARDLSDSPVFLLSGVEVCPGDLFASWSDAWDDVDAADKAKLAAFLKEPKLHLTEVERSAIAGHEDAFRESGWFAPLWARTCDEFRTANERRSFNAVLRLHIAGRFVGRDSVSENWEKKLASIYREDAIKALGDAATAEWPKPHEKRIFAYLRGELVRQSGRDAEAFAIFQDVIAAEKAAEPDEDLIWISEWAIEQSVRCSPDAKDAAKLLASVIPELPDPWREEKVTMDPRWPKHYVALDLLVSLAADGDKASSDSLWGLIERKPERLLALLETVESRLKGIRKTDARWDKWFGEIGVVIAAGKVPAELEKDPNHTRVTNVLRAAVGAGKDNPKAWREAVLLPVVRKAAREGGIPEIVIPEDDSFASLPGEDEVKAKPSLNDLSRALYDLWEEQPADVRPDIARVYIRILQKLPDEYESTDYPAMYFLPEIAETEEGRAAMAGELAGKWKGSFWKAACSYAARLPDSAEPFLRDPLTPKADSGLIVKLLLQRSDDGWQDQAIKKLENDGWVSSDVIRYLDSLDLPKTRQALDQFAERVRKGKKGSRDPKMDGELSSLQDIEGLRVGRKLAELPIR